jgi:hypothetical protein
VIALVLVACLAAGSLTLASADSSKVKKVKTKVSLAYKETGTAPYNQSSFSGKVKGKKGCKKSRKVSIAGVGKTKSSKSGKYSISRSSSAPAGTYQAKVKKKKIKKKGKPTIVCKKAKSKKVTVS